MADRIPTGPVEREPTGQDLPIQDRLRLVYGTLAGVELGAWNHCSIDWLGRNLDTPTLITIVSLVERARRAEAATVAADVAGLGHRRPQP